ncbi:hypothetical protein FB451DRAFT_1398969 [Mycena latifolia]|nr:hypothetical protein FB451DRAFT_1398969 [Mycena latifolia]
MERLRRALNECSTRHKQLQEFGDKQIALSLVRKLPAEILAEVPVVSGENEISAAIRGGSLCSLTLTHFTLFYIQLNEDILLAILALTPNLTHLVADDDRLTVSAALVDALAHVSLVPRLRSLTLYEHFTCANSALVEMLRARVRPRGTLRLLRLMAAFGSALDPCVDELRDEGLDVAYDLGGSRDAHSSV